MRYLRVKRENIYQHAQLDLSITGDILMVTGPNGSGKSNFLYSLCENLTGEFHQNKDRIVTRGFEKGVMEDMVLLPDGRQFEVRREFPSGKARFKMGEEIVVGASKVNDRILQVLGVEKNILSSLIFVGQKAISDLLFAKDSVKSRLAQKFFGLEKANLIEAMLAKEISAVVFDSSEGWIQGHRDRLHRSIRELEEWKLKRGAPVSAEEIKRLEDNIQAEKSLRESIDAHKKLKPIVYNMGLQVEGLRQEIEVDAAAFAKINPQLIEDLHARISAQIQNNAAITRSDAAIVENEKALNELGECDVTKDWLKERGLEKTAMEIRMGELRQSVNHRNGILASIGTSPACPTCGQPVDLSRREPIEKELETFGKELSELYAQHKILTDNITTLTKRYQEFTSNRDRIGGALLAARKERAKYGDYVQPTRTLEQVEAMRESYKSLKQSLDSKRTNLETLVNDWVQKRMELTTLTGYACMGGVDGAYYTCVDDVASMEQQLQDLRTRFSSQQEVAVKIGSLETTIEEIQGQLRIAEVAAVENRVADRYKKALEAMRSTFHPDGAPQTLVTRNNRLLEARVNGYLRELDAPFSVQAKEGLNFDCIFPEGVAYDSELSVGQQIDLSWAFRFAACETFCHTVGLMTLDEPTATLDEATCRAFKGIVEKLRGMSKTYGMQFFVSTHDKSLIPYGDQHISFNRHE